jgi:MFS family permease
VNSYGQSLTDANWTLLWAITNGLMPFGAIFGGLASGWAADYFGRYGFQHYKSHLSIKLKKSKRKKAILLNNLLVLLNVGLFVVSYYAPSYVSFMVARLIVGLMNGIFTGVGTMYLSESNRVTIGRIMPLSKIQYMQF